METKPATNQSRELAIKAMNETVLSVIGSGTVQLFEKAYTVADAIGKLQVLLTPEYMKPIMALQGNRLGFRTDKDKTGGYPEAVVKNCLIEATLMGLQVTGNQFNIIAGNTYPTKEGCGYLLNNFNGLKYKLVCSLPKINAEKTSAAVDVTVTWTLNGDTKTEVIPIPIKMDSYTSVDAVIGKATRKGRAWLLSTITGTEITDGEIEDVNHTVVSSTVKSPVDSELKRKQEMLKACETIADVEMLEGSYPDWDAELFKSRKAELKK